LVLPLPLCADMDRYIRIPYTALGIAVISIGSSFALMC
jgi:hypothetical protein